MGQGAANVLFAFLLLTLMFGCRPTVSDRDEYLRWFAHNGYHEQVERDGMSYSCFFRAPAFRAAKAGEPADMDSLADRYTDNLTFTFSVRAAEGAAGGSRAMDMTAYQLSEAELRRHFLLTVNGERLTPVMAYLEKGYELAAALQYTLVFDHAYEKGQRYELTYLPPDGGTPIDITVSPDHNIPALTL